MANAFNSPQKAALITEKAREILRTAIGFVSDQGFVLAHADTDSITFCKKDQTPFSESERMAILKNLNSLFPSRIRWEPEKPIEKMLVVTKRAYAMQFEDGALVIKGNSLRGNQRPRAFKECVQLLVKSRFEGNEEAAKDLKASYLNEIETLTDISRFAFRKRITSAVVSSERTFEKKLRLALFGSNYVHDDRVHFYFCKNQSIKLAQNWNGDHCKKRLLQQLKQSMEIVLGKGTYERL
jgi:DNA polymerase elongation subunit (family B)